MTAFAIISAKVSNNQHKSDQAWDWLKRIWLSWAILNLMGAILAYITPLFSGYAYAAVGQPGQEDDICWKEFYRACANGSTGCFWI